MFVRFFIDRPIFASVLAIIILMVGLLSVFALPIAQYPEISPPSVRVTANYTGADAETVDSRCHSIEEQVNGAQDMLYMSSISANDGSLSLTVTFELGRDLELATVDVQNRVNLATAQLPAEVRNSGIQVKKQSPDIVLIVNLTSQLPQFDTLFMNNYAKINIYDALKRIQGVGDVNLFGDQDYGMRIWLDPDKLASFRPDCRRRHRRGAGAERPGTGRPDRHAADAQGPAVPDVHARQGPPCRASGIRKHHHQANPDGSTVKVHDVAKVELGAKNYFTFARPDATPRLRLLIYQLPGANALDVAKNIRSTMKNFPKLPGRHRIQIP